MMNLDDIPEEALREALAATKNLCWVPNEGPQLAAFESQADEVFYGGAAGGGKTSLLLGLALTQHRRSLVLRRINRSAAGLVDDIASMVGTRTGYNGQTGIWHLPDGRIIEIGGCQFEEDKQKFKGIPHDGIFFDEVSDFTESQYKFLKIWNRTTVPGQRCRVVAAGNPPTRPEGLWVVKRWAAWLDPTHPNPAVPGELRWYYTDDEGRESEVAPRTPNALSRTFIPARLSDNPDLEATGYASVLENLPPELRAAYRDGKFSISTQDANWQCIPSAWVRAAQERWSKTPPAAPMCAMGVDPAMGGRDRTAIAIRHDGWYAPILAIPGNQTPQGADVAGLVVRHRRDGAAVAVDVGGGWGGEALACLRENGIPASAYMGIRKSGKRTVDGALKFTNIRTETYWRFREALDPGQPQGSTIALPPSPSIIADLCAPTYKLTPSGLALEAKEDVTERLGRSPDEGDAIVMAWSVGDKVANKRGGVWEPKKPRTSMAIIRKPRG